MAWKLQKAPRLINSDDNATFWFDNDGDMLFEDGEGWEGEALFYKAELMLLFRFLADELGYEIEG